MLGSLTTISVSEKTTKDVFKQLTDLIGDTVSIKSYCYKELEPDGTYKDDLVLMTSPWIKDRVLPILHQDCPYICAKRNLDLKKIHLLLDIPKGTEVLIVNDMYENAVEVVNELEAFSIDWFQAVAYDPAASLSQKYDYAVTIGEHYPVLETIPHVIDLGMRQINLLTVAEILHFFTDEIIVDELLTSRYVKESVQSICSLHNEIKKNQALKAQMESIVEDFSDGVLILENGSKVALCNKMARQILGLEGETLPQWFKEALGSESEEFFLQRDDKDIKIEVVDISNSAAKTQKVIIKDIALLRKINVDYHTYQKNQGHYAKCSFKDILHVDAAMKSVIRSARHMADSRSNILITGESGVGKELMAQAIHNGSPCSGGPFVAINCGAISEALLESELFGYDEGAFTGASKKGKIGLIELANNGTLFLDEIGDAPLSIQQKLLRVIQEKTILRVAGRQPINVDVRFIAATNQDLKALAYEKKFRLDLYYRLNVLTVNVPALRKRTRDIPLLFTAFLRKNLESHGKKMPQIDKNVLEILCNYPWPGNIRELENLSEYLANYIAHDEAEDLLRIVENYLAISRGKSSGGQSPAGLAAEGSGRKDETAMPVNSDSRIVLKALLSLSREGYLVSHRMLIRECADRGRAFTAYRLKMIIDALKEKGLVEAVIGKGTNLTAAGMTYAKAMRDEELSQ